MTTLLEELKGRNDDEMSRKLYVLAEEVCNEATNHLKLIINQLPEFDIHDESHSLTIIGNMESLIGNDSIKSLSSYELFLLHMSGYLHDCAMALPTWELNLLKMTEGKEGFTSNSIENSMPHDGKKPYKISEAIELINKNKIKLYGDFESTIEFIFSFSNEKEFQRDLATRLIAYQNFRNGYAKELDNRRTEGNLNNYLEFSDLLRYDFVRSTHAQRINTYIQNLSNKFSDRLGGAWGEALAKDLGKICQSHGESMEYVKKLQTQSNYYGPQIANLQFISIMLRLGDILHFSHDRAPRSLFVEKMITSKESLKHWKVKFQGINYSMNETDENGKKKIKYMAYCDEPSLYYFIQDYLDWVDVEISNYFEFFNGMKYFSRMGKRADNYYLNISEDVDRSQVRYNDEKFIPVKNMKFSLNQMKILELLMGVGLYKDKFLCLRELYQNALDASRCMISIMNDQNVNVRGNIEFGIQETTENNVKRKYIYCKDNGTGMTKEIIEKYFLNIGNSYYKSRDFQKLKSTWNSDFQPTSQFGIGILSCFMIGNKIEVTTIPINESKNEKSVSFSIDGPHEHFYFKNPDELDLEKIGSSGTLIKVFLNEDVEINDTELNENLQILIKGHNKSSYIDRYRELTKVWDKNIFKYIYSFIGIPDKSVDICVRFDTNKKVILDRWNKLITFEDWEEEQAHIIYKDFRYTYDGYNPIEDYLKVKESIKVKLLSVSSKDIEYSFLLSMPLPNLDILDWRILKFDACLYKESAVLIDGINISNMGVTFDLDHRRDLVNNGIINFVGSERPDISVDRNNITSLSPELNSQFNEIIKLLADKILEVVKIHFNEYKELLNEKQKMLIWDYIFKRYSSLTSNLIKSAIKTSIDLPLIDLLPYLEKKQSVPDFVATSDVSLKKLDVRNIGKTESMILIGKLIDANEVSFSNELINIKSESFKTFDFEREFVDESTLPIAIKADEWKGDLEEYDIVTGIWPIIPQRLFDLIKDLSDRDIVKGRSKFTSASGNSIASLANTDPVLVHPVMGLFTKRHHDYWRKRNWVGKFENRKEDFWLFELNNHGEMVKEKNEDFVLFTYISPRELSQEEIVRLEDFKTDFDYYSGVKNGWSILILGRSAEMVIKPGLSTREDLVKLIKPSFWKENENIIYKFIDGTLVRSSLK